MTKTWWVVLVPGILTYRAASASKPHPTELSAPQNCHIIYNHRLARKG